MPGTVDAPLLLVALGPDAVVDGALRGLDAAVSGALGRSLIRRDFRGGRDESLHLAGGTTGPQRVLLVGLGKGASPLDAIRRAATLGGRT
ncbi:MAG: hypothetical protein HOQ11_06910, partial [Gemmatimonadaceae bacterium]|nr:hypothetical protein [Gemmatimonadaceae bacterium]